MPLSEFPEELVWRIGGHVDRRRKTEDIVRAVLRESGHKELVEALRPFAEKLASVEAFIEDRASNGGSPIMPMNGLRLANFRNAVAALRKAGALPAEITPGKS